jgi:hypothetical protein
MKNILVISMLLTSLSGFSQSAGKVNPEKRQPEECSYAIRLVGVVMKKNYDNAWFSEENELSINWSYSKKQVTRMMPSGGYAMGTGGQTYVATVDSYHSEEMGYPTSVISSSATEEDMEFFLGDIETVSASDLHGKNDGLYLKFRLKEWNLVGYSTVATGSPSVYLKTKQFRTLSNNISVKNKKYTHKYSYTKVNDDADLYWDIFRSCKKLNPDVVESVTSEVN